MAYSYSGDFGPRSAPATGAYQQQQQPMQYSHFGGGPKLGPKSAALHGQSGEPLWQVGGPGSGATGPQSPAPYPARNKQAPSLGPSAPPVPLFRRDSALSEGLLPEADHCLYSWSGGQAQYRFSSWASCSENDLAGPGMLSNVSHGADDIENEEMASDLTELVNQLLEETESDSVSAWGGQQIPNLSQSMWLGSESIGELAIKLGDVALVDDDGMVLPHSLNRGQLASSLLKSVDETEAKFQVPKSGTVLSVDEASNAKPYHWKKGASSGTFRGEDKAGSKKKADGFLGNYKKKKYVPWNLSYNRSVNLPKDSRKVTAVNNINHYGGKLVQKQADKHMGSPFLEMSQSGGRKAKGQSSKFAGSPFWMQLSPNDRRSDGSSSSSSSVYTDSADFMKYKACGKSVESSPFPVGKHSRHVRKAHSISSSSSGGAKYSECVFCKTNGETPAMFRSHVLKDDQGRTTCHVLQRYVCPLCGATGISAHTVKYCPKNENPPPIATMTTLKSLRSSTGRKRHGPCSGHIRPIRFGFNRSPLPA